MRVPSGLAKGVFTAGSTAARLLRWPRVRRCGGTLRTRLVETTPGGRRVGADAAAPGGERSQDAPAGDPALTMIKKLLPKNHFLAHVSQLG